jgi:hypothetical protein
MTADDDTRARMDGDYRSPLPSGPDADLPIPAWDPPLTPSPTGEG